MQTSLDHLPPTKQRELERIVQILFAEFEDATALATQKWKKQGRILKVILYGSYARGGWVEDPVGGYYSDYDILVVVSDERLTDTLDYWAKAADHLLREYSIAKRLSAPVNFIVHSLKDVNEQLARGRPFFVDIVRDGVALYQLDGQPFDAPKPLDPVAAQTEAKTHFDQWYPKTQSGLKLARFAITEGENNDAAFLLHQTSERLYHCTLLVLTLYSPKSHKLNFLRDQAENVARDLILVWPRDTKFARRCFELLQQAYVNARYSPHYKITREELDWLTERVELLQKTVRDVCEQRLAPRD
ncbi:MAG: HEPN domain-containing protein [Alphaproteobacteria bacterium]|nr:HEPN domain-containing protein [Alphaproteobacteria bacterium]MBU0794062.1 HEPN domain-containing protein [Alphaproteobacteria bacterium]MBU1770236.1 HEPN domain-containing protein [Alphaproteobacteria bacterium]